ncbi:hypothetical protein BC749_104102 [Flavobacterium araucananum]|jgi:hypothetical protein|uniref:hypothetical protein n=1 Tax=Flavobacterium araucananum TaxID=946678 RepID=UPI000D78E9E5|nr:hypothetical protein [Flavobacterium araucananum]PWJ98956.1 hypothetical protein BC749_104102 [Flavobacterium araucananum]
MKKLLILGAFALLSTTLFSCTADDYDDVKTTTKPAIPTYADGPGDAPIPVPPPPVKN